MPKSAQIARILSGTGVLAERLMMTKRLVALCVGVAFVLALAASGSRPARAACLGPGVNFGGANNGWTTAPCAQGAHSGSYNGGSRAAAALGAASAAIGILGAFIDAAQRADQAERSAANEAARRRWAYCNAKYRRAYALNERAGKLLTNPELAMQQFEAALLVLDDCGTRSDLAKLRNNINLARSDYAALTKPSSTRMYGGNAPATTTVAPDLLQLSAKNSCRGLSERGASWDICMQNRKADLILTSDPDIRNACQSIADRQVRNRCVFNRYWARVQGKDPNPFGDSSNCYWDEHGQPCHAGGDSSASARSAGAADKNRENLRNRLKEALRSRVDRDDGREREEQAAIDRLQSLRDAMQPGPDRDAVDRTLAKLKADQTPAGAIAPPQGVRTATAPQPSQDQPAKQMSSTDDAYANYMNGKSDSSGGKRNGDLGAPAFDMRGSETRQEINRLLGQ